jgi:hypothetical protein
MSVKEMENKKVFSGCACRQQAFAKYECIYNISLIRVLGLIAKKKKDKTKH